MTQAAALTTPVEEDDLIMGKEEGDHRFWERLGFLMINSSRIKKTVFVLLFLILSRF